jgi:(2Fe-2S) ferredoxin
MNYNYHIFCCVNERAGNERTSCKKKDSHLFRNYIKQKVNDRNIKNVRVNQSGCLDECEACTVIVIYPQGIWYKCENFKDADDIVDSLITGEIVQHLQIKN